ncbi:MAG: quinone-dependent dihydroorotate dehydrogenase [Bacteroidota bacterium]
MYNLLRNILFLFDAEKVHYFSMNVLKAICKISFIKWITHKIYKAEHPVKAMGIEFTNMVGLGAGFDKNAKYLTELETLGFGFVEIGTVTPKYQEGNQKPRLFRLPQDKALINRMGFNNEGADIISKRLSSWRKNNPKSKLIIGGNIGKNKSTPNEDAWKDYESCFKVLYDYVDYFVVNVSSPNTPGLRALQEKDSLKQIFKALQKINPKKKSILLKIAPDLSIDQLNDIIDLWREIQLDGLIVSNTTIDRNNLKTSKIEIEKIGMGGLSGLPIIDKSTAMLKYIHQQTEGKLFMIGSGGIFTAQHANEKINSGASLVQVWTGFIYEGPIIVKNIISALKN